MKSTDHTEFRCLFLLLFFYDFCLSACYFIFYCFLFYFLFSSAAYIHIHYYDRQVRRLNVLISVYRHKYYAN